MIFSQIVKNPIVYWISWTKLLLIMLNIIDISPKGAKNLHFQAKNFWSKLIIFSP
jgi:hypothetical protein